MTAIALAFLAGVFTTGNPCVLPMLPLVLAGTLSGGKFGPLAFAAGMVGAFTVVGVGIITVGYVIGLTPEMVRAGAALALIAFGLVLMVPQLQERFALATSGLSTGAQTLSGRVSGEGPGSSFLIGLLAGALWSPCAGPSLGAAIGLAVEAGGAWPAALRMLAFATGAVGVLLLLAYGSQAVIRSRRDAMMAASNRLKPVLGGLLVLAGLFVVSGFDKAIEAFLTARMPEWLTDITLRF